MAMWVPLIVGVAGLVVIMVAGVPVHAGKPTPVDPAQDYGAVVSMEAFQAFKGQPLSAVLGAYGVPAREKDFDGHTYYQWDERHRTVHLEPPYQQFDEYCTWWVVVSKKTGLVVFGKAVGNGCV